jgi:hypothetical protein
MKVRLLGFAFQTQWQVHYNSLWHENQYDQKHHLHNKYLQRTATNMDEASMITMQISEGG